MVLSNLLLHKYFCGNALGSLVEFQAAFFAVASKQPEHRFRMTSKMRQRFIYRYHQRRKLLEVLVVRRLLFRLLPQVFNRIIVRRIRRQRMPREAVGMRGKNCCVAWLL